MPLDRARPLWEIHVVEGLYDGNVALIGKIHHAAVDGVSGAELFIHLFDLTPHPPDESGTEATGDDSAAGTAPTPATTRPGRSLRPSASRATSRWWATPCCRRPGG